MQRLEAFGKDAEGFLNTQIAGEDGAESRFH